MAPSLIGSRASSTCDRLLLNDIVVSVDYFVASVSL